MTAGVRTVAAVDTQDWLVIALVVSVAALWAGLFWIGRLGREMRTALTAAVDRMERASHVDEDKRQHLTNVVDRMEQATFVVADQRTAIKDNLADSVSRADATEGPDGAAADAALRTGDTAQAITDRQDAAR